jgi:hypothetical protein
LVILILLRFIQGRTSMGFEISKGRNLHRITLE